MSEYQKEYKELVQNSKLLSDLAPNIAKSFKSLHAETTKDAKLDMKTKEFVALGIAIATRCEGCILSHIKTVIGLGATLEELAEVVGVAVLMGGGPAKNYGGKALAMAKEILEEAN